MIPKLIHYCWFGEKPLAPLSRKCIESWKRYCPDWTIKEWNTSNSPIHLSYMLKGLKHKNFSNMSNLVRLHAVYNEGGIYLNADIELIKNLDIFLKESCFFSFGKEDLSTNTFTDNAVFGAVKNHPFVKELLDALLKYFDGKESSWRSGPGLITTLLLKKGLSRNINTEVDKTKLGDITIFPRRFFHPDCADEKLAPQHIQVQEDTCVIHCQAESRLSEQKRNRVLSILKQSIKYVLNDILHISKSLTRRTKCCILIGRRLISNKTMMTDRYQINELLNCFDLTGKGVEVGAWKGDFSAHILGGSNLSIVYSVDPWKEYDKNLYDDITNVDHNTQEKNHQLTVEKLARFGKRSIILRMDSCEASRLFDQETLNFIYIDANHSYEESKKDLTLWWPKLKKGGLFAGHDYLNGEFLEGIYGVKRAVDEFVKTVGGKLYVTSEEWPTWYLFKK